MTVSVQSPERPHPWEARLRLWRQRLRTPLSQAVLVRLLLAFGLSVALWVYITSQDNPVQTRSFTGVLVTARGVPQDEVVTLSAPTIQVQAEGLARDLDRVQIALIQAYVTLNHGQGVTGNTLLPVHVDLAVPNITLRTISPALERVAVDFVARRSIPVSVLASGTAPAGYIVGNNPYADPPVITVSGLQTVVDQVKGAVVDVNLATAVHAPRQILAPTLVNAAGLPISQPPSITPGLVTVTINMQQVSTQKTLPINPQIIGTPQRGYLVSAIIVTPTIASLTGSQSAVVPLAAVQTAPLNIDGLAGAKTFQTTLLLPPGVALVKPNQQFTVRVVTTPLYGSLDTVAGVAVTGVSSALQAKVSPSTIMVRLSGALPDLSAVSVPRAWVDVGGRGPGKYTLEPNVLLPSGVSVVSVSPEVVGVVISPAPPVPTTPPPTAAVSAPTATPVATTVSSRVVASPREARTALSRRQRPGTG